MVVADGLLALAGELGVVEAEAGLREGAQVGLLAEAFCSVFSPTEIVRMPSRYLARK